MRRVPLLLLIAGAAVLAATAVAVVLMVSGQEETTELLPDLDQDAPGELSGRNGGTPTQPRFFLGFTSAAGNVGEGPLIVDGKRPDISEPGMRLVQRIVRSDGSVLPADVRASLRYVTSATHAHWHLLGFMRYELRTVDGRRVRRDHKTGFCLGDRYQLELRFDGAPTSAVYNDNCGKSRPKLLKLREGISVGWGDDYKPNLEGQEFDVTTLPPARYVLVHRVNPERVLRESDYSDNASSMAFDLTWPHGRRFPPRVEVVARCAGTDTCP